MPAVAERQSLAKRPYQARGAAFRLWTCREEEILIEGPAGTGKTRAALEKVHYCMMKYPGARALLVRKTRESLTDSVLVTFEEKVVPANSMLLDGPQRNLRQHYSYPNGSEIVVGGVDKSSKFMSTEYDIIVTFETLELAEPELEDLTTRLRNGVMPYQQLISDCNPGAPSHWLNRRAKTGKMLRLKSRHVDNPVFFHELKTAGGVRYTPTEAGKKYLKKLERLSGPKRKRLYNGIWAATEGMVYEDFDETTHCIPRFEIPADWPRLRSIDFGYTNPFVCQWWAMDGDGRMFRYREIYYSHRLVQDHADGIRNLENGKLIEKGIKQYSEGEHYVATVSDHDAEGRATLHGLGIETIPAYKTITQGIEAVSLRLRPAGDGKARIYFLKDSLVHLDSVLEDAGLPTSTELEIEGYSYRPVKDDKAVKEEPIDKDNHGMDTMRYAVAYIDNIAGDMINVTTEAATGVPR